MVQLLADAAAAGRGKAPIEINKAEAEATFKGISRGGWFSGLPEFQVLEAREGQKFEIKK
jgi:hypothetical protein